MTWIRPFLLPKMMKYAAFVEAQREFYPVEYATPVQRRRWRNRWYRSFAQSDSGCALSCFATFGPCCPRIAAEPAAT